MDIEDRQYLQMRVRVHEYLTEAQRRRKGNEREWDGWQDRSEYDEKDEKENAKRNAIF